MRWSGKVTKIHNSNGLRADVRPPREQICDPLGSFTPKTRRDRVAAVIRRRGLPTTRGAQHARKSSQGAGCRRHDVRGPIRRERHHRPGQESHRCRGHRCRDCSSLGTPPISYCESGMMVHGMSNIRTPNSFGFGASHGDALKTVCAADVPCCHSLCIEERLKS